MSRGTAPASTTACANSTQVTEYTSRSHQPLIYLFI